jgi:deoxycytidine triphosphate deaminase
MTPRNITAATTTASTLCREHTMLAAAVIAAEYTHTFHVIYIMVQCSLDAVLLLCVAYVRLVL